MLWKGKELKTLGDVKDAIESIDSPDEARQFMEEYKKDSPSADMNVGYLSGYFGVTNARKIRKLFGVSHPVFGDEDWSPQDAFNLGMRVAKEAIQSGKDFKSSLELIQITYVRGQVDE